MSVSTVSANPCCCTSSSGTCCRLPAAFPLAASPDCCPRVSTGGGETIAGLFDVGVSLANQRLAEALGQAGMDPAPDTLPLSGQLRMWADLGAMIFAEPDFLMLDVRRPSRGPSGASTDPDHSPAQPGRRGPVSGDNIRRGSFDLGLRSGRRACQSRAGRREQDYGRRGQGAYQGRTLNGSCQPFGEAENIS